MDVDIRKGMPDPHVCKEEFRNRFFARFYDPAFASIRVDLEQAMEIAWKAYEDSRKAPRTRAAGERFADPEYQISEDWWTARQAIEEAASRHKNRSLPANVLVINASPRSEHTCPGEMSKTYRLVETVLGTFNQIPNFQTNVLDLSRLTSSDRFFLARLVFRQRQRFVIGLAPVTPTMRLASRQIG